MVLLSSSLYIFAYNFAYAEGRPLKHGFHLVERFILFVSAYTTYYFLFYCIRFLFLLFGCGLLFFDFLFVFSIHHFKTGILSSNV